MIDVWVWQIFMGEVVDNGVFNFQCVVLVVMDFVIEVVKMYCEGGVRVEYFCLWNGLYVEVQIQIVVYVIFVQWQYDV